MICFELFLTNSVMTEIGNHSKPTDTFHCHNAFQNVHNVDLKDLYKVKCPSKSEDFRGGFAWWQCTHAYNMFCVASC